MRGGSLLLAALLALSIPPYFIGLGDNAIWDANEAFYRAMREGDLDAVRVDEGEAVGALQQAVDDFNQAMLLDPQDADAYNNRAVAYRGKGDWDKAIADVKAWDAERA